MRWPWSSSAAKPQLVLRHSADLFAYVVAQPGSASPKRVLQWGALWRGQDSPAQFTRRVRALGLSGAAPLALLDPSEYQVLKVETPNVPQDELKAAARWQIKDLIDAHLDDVTLDVMHVGDALPRPNHELFVIAAPNKLLLELAQRCSDGALNLRVVDIWETALRNLQSAQARLDGLAERACAALFVQDDKCLLSICAGDELYYTRRLDWDAGLAERARGSSPQAGAAIEQPLGFEYMPGDALDILAQTSAGDAEESALIIELQRSVDVWERSWPALPLARLYLILPGENSDIVAAMMQRVLGLRVVPLLLGALFDGIEDANQAARQDEFSACTPLLGACLRLDKRQI